MTERDWTGIAVYVAIAGAAILIGVVAEWRVKRNALRKIVRRDLECAKDNGYFDLGECLHGASAHDIANDMICYAEHHEGCRPERLVPHIVAWLRMRGAPLPGPPLTHEEDAYIRTAMKREHK